MNINISFKPDGTAQCLWTEALPLHELGRLEVTRGSNIEFNNATQHWEVEDRKGRLQIHRQIPLCLPGVGATKPPPGFKLRRPKLQIGELERDRFTWRQLITPLLGRGRAGCEWKVNRFSLWQNQLSLACGRHLHNCLSLPKAAP